MSDCDNLRKAHMLLQKKHHRVKGELRRHQRLWGLKEDGKLKSRPRRNTSTQEIIDAINRARWSCQHKARTSNGERREKALAPIPGLNVALSIIASLERGEVPYKSWDASLYPISEAEGTGEA